VHSQPTTLAAPQPLVLPDGRAAIEAWSLDPSRRHLNHGSFGAVPVRAQEYQERLRAEMDAAPVSWFSSLPARVAAARVQVAGFLRTPASDLAFVPNASGGVSVVYNSLPMRKGGEIVVTDHGYGAVTMGAERLARQWSGTVRTAHVPLGAGPQEAHDAVVAEFRDRTALVVVDQITSPTARHLPVQSISATAKERGIPVFVDGAHVPGLVGAPLEGLDCDFWVGNLHKFACSPRGAAALVARGPLAQELRPLIDSWGAPYPYPERFDTQGTIDASSYLSAEASIDLVAGAWGWDNARNYMAALAGYAQTIIGAAFEESAGHDASVDVGMPVNAIRMVRLPEGLATTREEADALRDRVARELGVETAFTASGGKGYFRLSTHVYTTAQDFEYFAEHCVPILTKWARENKAAR
jgi:isopenicillin-N epimerase